MAVCKVKGRIRRPSPDKTKNRLFTDGNGSPGLRRLCAR